MGFLQNPFRNEYLAYVVEQAGQAEHHEVVLSEPDELPEQDGEHGHVEVVCVGILVILLELRQKQECAAQASCTAYDRAGEFLAVFKVDVACLGKALSECSYIFKKFAIVLVRFVYDAADVVEVRPGVHFVRVVRGHDGERSLQAYLFLLVFLKILALFRVDKYFHEFSLLKSNDLLLAGDVGFVEKNVRVALA